MSEIQIVATFSSQLNKCRAGATSYDRKPLGRQTFGLVKEQVAANKSSLLLKIQIENAQALQLFTNIIKTKSIYKSYYNAEQKARVQRPSGLIKIYVEAQALLVFFKEAFI